MPPGPDHDEDWKPALGDYVRIVDTSDEFEGVIGILDEFIPESQDLPAPSWAVFVPTSRADLRSRRMGGVNELTPFVRYTLRENDGRVRIQVVNLELFDTEEL